VKKIGIINQPISAVIAGLGHTDTVVIADAGLPIPPEPQRIDLALTEGIPTFLDAVKVVCCGDARSKPGCIPSDQRAAG
jgi:D-ribose pyranase